MFSFKDFLNEWDGTQLDLPIHLHTHYKPSDHSETQMHPEDLKIQSDHRDHFRYYSDAHYSYKDDSESNFNNHLRSGFNGRHIELPHYDEGHGDVDWNVHKMDHNTSVELKHPLKTYRGFKSSFRIHHLSPGDEFTDHGYTGTSLSKHTAQSFSDMSEVHPGHHAVAVIHSPAGTKGHLLDHPDHPDTNLHEEKEFTLQRGTTFRVHHHELHHDVATGRNYHMIHLHVTDQHAHHTYTRDPESEEDEDDYHHHDEDE